MSSAATGKVVWEADAGLQVRERTGFWVGRPEGTGTVVEMLKRYRELTPEKQGSADLFVAGGVVEGFPNGLIYGEDLRALASRSDIPE